MHALVLGIIGGLAGAAASLTGRVLLALGIGFVAYQGIDIALDGLFGLARSSISGFSGSALQVLGVLQLDRAVNIVASAITARLVILGLTSGVIKRMVLQ